LGHHWNRGQNEYGNDSNYPSPDPLTTHSHISSSGGVSRPTAPVLSITAAVAPNTTPSVYYDSENPPEISF
jgi:hypothetical protein